MPESYSEDFEVLSSQGSDDELMISDGDINLSDVEAYSSLHPHSIDYRSDFTDFDNGSSLIEINNNGIPNVLSLSASLALNSLIPLDHDLEHDGAAENTQAPPASPNVEMDALTNEKATESTITLNAASSATSPSVIPRLLLLLDGGVDNPAKFTTLDVPKIELDPKSAEVETNCLGSAYTTLNQWFTGCSPKEISDNSSQLSTSSDPSTTKFASTTSASTDYAFTHHASTDPTSSHPAFTGSSPLISASSTASESSSLATKSVLNIMLSGVCTEETREYVTQLYASVPNIALSWYDTELDTTLVLPTKNGENEALHQIGVGGPTTRIKFLDARSLGSSPMEVSEQTKQLVDDCDFIVILGSFDMPTSCLNLPPKQAAVDTGNSWRARNVFTNNPTAALTYRTLLHSGSVENNMPLQSNYSSLRTPEQRIVSLVKRALFLVVKTVLSVWIAALVGYAGIQCYEFVMSSTPISLVGPENIVISNFTDTMPTVELPKELQVVDMDQDVSRVLIPVGLDVRRMLAEMALRFRSQLEFAQAMLMKLVSYVGEELPRPNLNNTTIRTLKASAESLLTFVNQGRRVEAVNPVLNTTAE